MYVCMCVCMYVYIVTSLRSISCLRASVLLYFVAFLSSTVQYLARQRCIIIDYPCNVQFLVYHQKSKIKTFSQTCTVHHNLYFASHHRTLECAVSVSLSCALFVNLRVLYIDAFYSLSCPDQRILNPSIRNPPTLSLTLRVAGLPSALFNFVYVGKWTWNNSTL